MQSWLNACGGRFLGLAAFAIVMGTLGGGAMAASPGIEISDCRSAAKAFGTAQRLACEVLFVPTEEQKRVLAQETAAMVLDLRCTLSVDVSEADLAAMQTTSVWQAPAQPAVCDVTTSAGPYTASLSLAPRIALIGGKAIGVKLNTDDIVGVPPLIGNAMRSYIDLNPAFQDALMDIVNEHLSDRLKASTRAES